MKTKVTQEKALRWAAQGLTLLVVLVAAVAMNLYFKIDELEATPSQARAASDKTNQAAAEARKSNIRILLEETYAHVERRRDHHRL